MSLNKRNKTPQHSTLNKAVRKTHHKAPHKTHHKRVPATQV